MWDKGFLLPAYRRGLPSYGITKPHTLGWRKHELLTAFCPCLALPGPPGVMLLGPLHTGWESRRVWAPASRESH